MNELEEKLGAILGDPKMMQQIMSIAGSLGQQPQTPDPPGEKKPPDTSPAADLNALKKLGSLAGRGIDRDQQNLLRALRPYLCQDRITRLERAMRSAAMAKAVTQALKQGGR